MPRVSVTPRKRPRQARSRATVEAILEAAAQVLELGGIRALTTTRVAARAGVSIGTLYQYYPGREALLDELVRREQRRALEAAQAAVEARSGSLADRLEAGVAALLALKRRAPGLHRALTVDLPRVDGLTTKRQAAPRLHELLRALAAEHAAELPAPPSRTAVVAAVHAVEGVLGRALEDPELLGSKALAPIVSAMMVGALSAR